MIDVRTWNTIVELLSVIDHSRRPDDQNTDAMGNIHLILFGDFKRLGCNLVPMRTRRSQSLRDLRSGCRQLPPATSQAPFIKLESCYNFLDFRVLRQNRRVVKGDDDNLKRKAEIENFHGELLSRRMCRAIRWHMWGQRHAIFARLSC